MTIPTVYNFPGKPQGSQPEGSLSTDGTYLYGMTYSGGDGLGLIYKFDPSSGSALTTFHNFTGRNGDGSEPAGDVILLNGSLCGTTRTGGSSKNGTIFAIPLS